MTRSIFYQQKSDRIKCARGGARIPECEERALLSAAYGRRTDPPSGQSGGRAEPYRQRKQSCWGGSPLCATPSAPCSRSGMRWTAICFSGRACKRGGSSGDRRTPGRRLWRIGNAPEYRLIGDPACGGLLYRRKRNAPKGAFRSGGGRSDSMSACIEEWEPAPRRSPPLVAAKIR